LRVKATATGWKSTDGFARRAGFIEAQSSLAM
jgi:hypothetical protein